jgi:hypothetical protein
MGFIFQRGRQACAHRLTPVAPWTSRQIPGVSLFSTGQGTPTGIASDKELRGFLHLRLGSKVFVQSRDTTCECFQRN